MSAISPFPGDDVPAAVVPKRSFTLPAWRQVWFRLHWLIGITAGSVLMVIGLSGATLAFREELLDTLNPGVRHVEPRAMPVLTPGQLVQAVRNARPHERVAQLTVSAEAGVAVRVMLAPPFGVRRGEMLLLDPYTGAMQPALRGAEFFEWVEQLHRWLLLPRDDGRLVTGTLAICLLGMALSGLYLRWPKQALNWRAWLLFDTRLKGRSFLWGLHSVLGTWALVMYLVSTSTGIYWAFDTVRSQVDRWLAAERPNPDAKRVDAGKPNRKRGDEGRSDGASSPIDLAAAWSAFEQRAGAWKWVSMRLPQRPGQPVDVNWLAVDAPHERARNRMLVQASGEVTQDDRYEHDAADKRLQAIIYPLHMGSYFGLPGRIAMTFAGLALPAFGVTGWMLYLQRRRAGRAARRERAMLLDAQPHAVATSEATWLIAYASQTGQAERLAWRSAASLAEAGIPSEVRSVASLDAVELGRHGRILLIASSFGDGEPPDSARRFIHRLEALDPIAQPLRNVRFGLLALGNRRYARFCGFGHRLDAALRTRGADSLFAPIEVDDGEADVSALARWSDALADATGRQLSMPSPEPVDGCDPGVWTLSRRQLLNPGSQGGPLHELTLTSDRAVDWRPGALVDIVPQHASPVITGWLAASEIDPGSEVWHRGAKLSLVELLTRSELPPPRPGVSAQTWAATLAPLQPRRYSVASITQDAAVELLVRQEKHAEGLGVASGWLTEYAPVGASIDMRLVPNDAFAPVGIDAPCVFIGNGSGLAGLRAHLRERVRLGQPANWLVFGERERAHDQPCRDEIAHWQSLGMLERVDLVFSRDPPRRTYVQDRLLESADSVRAWVERGACFYICGSLHGMSSGVDAALREVLGTQVLDDLMTAGRYRRDVY